MKLSSKALIGLFAISVSANVIAQAARSDADAVRATVTQETAAWEKYDAHSVAALYTSDAIWQNPFGLRLHGSAELEKWLTELFQRPGYRSAKDTSPAKITDIRFPSPTVAVVWSEETSVGQIDDSTGKTMAPRHSHYLEVLVKKDDGWKISECIIMDEIGPHR